MALQIQTVALLRVSSSPRCGENVYTQQPNSWAARPSRTHRGTWCAAPCTHLQPLTPSHTCLRVFMLLPCSLVSPGTDELLPVRALKLLQVPTETCACPLSHMIMSVNFHKHTKGLHTGNRLQQRAFHSHTHTHSCVPSIRTQTHSNHTPTSDTHVHE